MSFNKITIIGNLGRDPELNYLPDGTPVCKIAVATNEKKRTKSGETEKVTTWFRITLWRGQAETAAKYLQKGSSVYVEGRLRAEEWTDRDGKTRFALDVSGSELRLIDSASAASNGNGSGQSEEGEIRTVSRRPPRALAASAAAGGQRGSIADDDESARWENELNPGTPADDDVPF